MARTFTRTEFYELVWSKPLTHLAKEFALSDVALHKVCKKHGIPHPPLGWWAKKAAGKPVTRTPLPDPEGTTKITIVGGELANEPAPLSAAREHARIIASASANPTIPSAHPTVDKTIAALRKAKPGEKGLVVVDSAKMIKCAVSPDSIDRLADFLSCLVQAAALQGFGLDTGEKQARFANGEEAIAFAITEQVRREKHQLTETEQTKLDAWEQKRARSREPWRYYSDRPQFPEWDYIPTGKLALEFNHEYFLGSAPRRAFNDAKIQRLENLINEIAVGLVVYAAAKVEDRRQRREKQERAEEESRRRELAERSKYIEERRTTALDAILGEIEKLDRLRNLLASLASRTRSANSARVETFLQWATAHLAAREERLMPLALESRFAEKQLFGETDDHDYRQRSFY